MILTEEKYLLSQLMIHSRLNIYELYASTNFSTGQIVRMLFKYQKKGYLIVLGKTIFRTPIGRYRLRRINYNELKVERYWRTIPQEMLGKKIEVNIPPDRIITPKKLWKAQDG